MKLSFLIFEYPGLSISESNCRREKLLNDEKRGEKRQNIERKFLNCQKILEKEISSNFIEEKKYEKEERK